MTGPRKARSAPRVRRRCKVTIAGSSTFTSDVSATGFCVELMRVLPAGSVISGTISLKGQEFSFEGKVAWAKAGDMRLNMRGKMGVAFTRIPESFRPALADGGGVPQP